MFVNSTHLVIILLLFISDIMPQKLLDWLCLELLPRNSTMFWFMLPTTTPLLCNGAIAVTDTAKEPLPEFPKLSMKELRAAE